MATFEIPEMRDRLDIHNFVLSSNNLVLLNSVLTDLLTNLQHNQELAQLEFDLSLLELKKTSSQNLTAETIGIKQKLADIETLKVKNFKHNNQEELKTILFIQSVLKQISNHVLSSSKEVQEAFESLKHDTYIGCVIQQNLYAIDADCRIDPTSAMLSLSKLLKVDPKGILNECLLLEELPKII